MPIVLLHEFFLKFVTVYVIYYGNLQFTESKKIRHFYVQIKDILLFFYVFHQKIKLIIMLRFLTCP